MEKMKNTDNKIIAAVAGNLSLAGVGNFIANLGPILHLILTLGQVGVAVATIVYIVKKIRQIGKTNDKNSSSNSPGDIVD